jgi:hypothetical protein
MKYANDYKLLIDSGLYNNLTTQQLLIKHEECQVDIDLQIENAYIFCKPEQLDFISFPSEWCFSQYKDSAITTLDILKISLHNGMILKDSNAVNVQLFRGKTTLIDTSSFCKYEEGDYWKGYKQFVEHFFIPLKVANTNSVEIFKLLLYFKEGIPIWKSISFFKTFDFFNFSTFIHIFLFSKSAKQNIKNNTEKKISKLALLGILNSLYSGILKLKKGTNKSEWKDYYSYTNNYQNNSFNYKAKFILEIVENESFGKVLDLGSNTGYFSRLIHKHVDYIIQQITKKMVAYILKKKKIEVKPSIIKEQLTIFLNSTIVNPSFDSQTKDYLNTPSSKFGSSCTVSDKFIEKLASLGVLNTSCELSEVKEKKESKKTDGSKTKTIRGIPKLIDANYAGTKKSGECILILCEGDSAKSGIVSGLGANDRNIYGIYPMKGKLLNVRGEILKKINENKEIAEIKKILGLETGKTYKDAEELRYGKVLFMTDQDLDGSHIKGLGINMFECLWPSLLKITGFIGFMNTPILKATKGTKSLSFYNDNEYEAWKSGDNGNGWKVKYYKGLGTSTGKEFREYFEHKKIVEIEVGEKDTEDMDMLFNKKKAEQRKEWLTNYDRDVHLDTSLTNITDRSFSSWSNAKMSTDLVIPPNVINIYEQAFQNWTSNTKSKINDQENNFEFNHAIDVVLEYE